MRLRSSTLLLASCALGVGLLGFLFAWKGDSFPRTGHRRSTSATRNPRGVRSAKSSDSQLDSNQADKTYSLPVSNTNEVVVDASSIDFERDVMPIFETRCFECHSGDSQEGELDITSILAQNPWVRNRELWVKISQYLALGAMPPQDCAQPTPEERATVVAWIDRMLETFDYETVKSPGFERAHRLSHHEYDATIRDLLGLELHLDEKFPEENSGTSGFDNSENTLFLQPLLLERYLAAAEELLDVATQGTPPASPVLAHMISQLSEVQESSERERVGAVLQEFMLHAYRHPPIEEQVQHIADYYMQQRESGISTTKALQAALSLVLVAPEFLLRIETSANQVEYHISEWDLASRLSYFLWASMPDERLFTLAQQGRLSQPAVLASEVDRMLDDPRSDTLGTIFAAQWLGFQHLGTRVHLDPTDNPWCTETLMQAMRDESSSFFNSLVRENQPLERLIDADYTFLNEELAEHYRIRFVHGDEIRRVQLKDDRRGGIFGQGSLLAVTSFPDRTSPVVRGKWILATVLGTPPPPPPPNAGQLDETEEGDEEREVLSLREKLAIHRSQAECSICHNQIDPLGLSLEHYDNFGRWRRSTEVGSIDATGQLPNGTKFADLSGLRRVIIEQRMDDLARQITLKMLSYALGRQVEYFDEASLQGILQQFEQDDYRLRSLIHAIVKSYPFQFKRRPDAA